MNRLFHFLLLIFTLTGCGAGDRAAPWRSIQVGKDHVCFSVNKSDVLSRYSISSVQDGAYKELATNEYVALSYPDSCLYLSLTPGYLYGVSYTLNHKNYRYVFFIDNDWNIQSSL